MKKIIIASILLTISTFFYGQVTVSITNLKVNGTTIPNGSPIDLGNNSTVEVTFRVDLSKPNYLTIGACEVWISSFNGSGQVTHYGTNATVSESQFVTGASKNYSITIYASSIDYSNNNYLSATLEQDNSPFAIWESQHISIIKTPNFQLTPSSLSLPCGDTSSRTFTVTNNSNLSGVTYQWNIGNGWSGNVGNSNSITLTPINGALLPSNVSVTPYVNGVAQTPKTCTISRAPFTSTSYINGTNLYCTFPTTSIYTINAGAGNTVSWSSSNPYIANVSGGNNSQVTVTTQAEGGFSLMATITNSCGQVITKNLPIWIGIQFPIFSNLNGTQSGNVFNYGYNGFGNFEYNSSFWDEIFLNNPMGDMYGVEFEVYNPITDIYIPRGNGSSVIVTSEDAFQMDDMVYINVRGRVLGDCGWSNWEDLMLTSYAEFFYRTTQNIFNTYPNPSKDFVFIKENKKDQLNNSNKIQENYLI